MNAVLNTHGCPFTGGGRADYLLCRAKGSRFSVTAVGCSRALTPTGCGRPVLVATSSALDLGGAVTNLAVTFHPWPCAQHNSGTPPDVFRRIFSCETQVILKATTIAQITKMIRHISISDSRITTPFPLSPDAVLTLPIDGGETFFRPSTPCHDEPICGTLHRREL